MINLPYDPRAIMPEKYLSPDGTIYHDLSEIPKGKKFIAFRDMMPEEKEYYRDFTEN